MFIKPAVNLGLLRGRQRRLVTVLRMLSQSASASSTRSGSGSALAVESNSEFMAEDYAVEKQRTSQRSGTEISDLASR